MNVLIVDDELELLKKIAVLTEANGHNVKVATSVEGIKTILRSKNFYPNVVVLDRLLNGLDSVGLISEIKTSFAGVQILVLSAIDTATEKASALNAGADDYLSKPFSSIELTARINALARRNRLYDENSCLQIGNLKLNGGDRSAKVGEVNILDLSNKEFQILYLFCSNPGKVFSKEILLEQIWKTSTGVETKVVEATINNLRRKLEFHSASVKIKNMRNVGYWLEA